MMREQRTVIPLSEMKPTFAQCGVHVDRKAEWWCLECNKALCVNCKVSGGHSKGRAAGHSLAPIKERYCEVIEHVRNVPPVAQEAKDGLLEQINLIDGRSGEVFVSSYDVLVRSGSGRPGSDRPMQVLSLLGKTVSIPFEPHP